MDKVKDIKAEIKGKCDEINEIVEGELSYPEHRAIQCLLCDILEIFDNYAKSTES